MRHRLVLVGMICGLVGAFLAVGCARLGSVEAVLEASPSEGAAPLRVQLQMDQSTYGSSGPGAFVLDFGDGTSSVENDDLGMPIPHVYGPVGTYVARLTVTASDGRMAESTATIVAGSGEVPEGSAVGTRAYDFTAPTTDGREITLSELCGSVVLIEFWGSWCIPCKTSMPHINALWEAYHDQGLVVLAVSTDTRAEDAVDYLAKNGFTGLTCLWEPGGKSTRIKLLYQVDWIPRSIIVDRTGIVRYNGHPMDLEAAFVEALLAESMPESTKTANSTD
ncbi:MAG: redoxin domain-containing protein [Candidatus Bipolaricaulota bacterium]|nr:redoxin domain-containing protein [Candidatus Bipolaricaulota bacterium]